MFSQNRNKCWGSGHDYRWDLVLITVVLKDSWSTYMNVIILVPSCGKVRWGRSADEAVGNAKRTAWARGRQHVCPRDFAVTEPDA